MGRRITAILFALTVIGASVLTVIIGHMPVDLALDAEGFSGEGLQATWSTGSVSLEEIDTAYAPHHFEARLIAPAPQEGEKQRKGFQVITMAGVEEARYTPESSWANISTYYFLMGPERPAELRISGWNLGPNPYFSFETDRISDSVRVESGEGPPVALDLFSQQLGRKVTPIATDTRLRRFYGEVPRKALAELEFNFLGAPPTAVRRIYINSFFPNIYAGENIALPLVPPFYLGASPISTWLICSALSLVGLLALAGLGMLGQKLYRNLARYPGDDRLTVPPTWKSFGVFWVPVFMVWLIFLVAFYPGTLNVDSLSQWEQAQAFSFEAQHPPFYAWLMWLARQVWESPFAVALPQVCFGSALVALSASLLWTAGVPRGIVLAMYALCTLSPRNMTMMIALIKDGPYGICMYLAAILLAWIILRRTRPNYMLWVCLGVAFGVSTLFRHNGLLMAVGTLPFLLLFFMRQWRSVLLCAAMIMVVMVGARVAVLSRIPIEKSSGGLHDLLTAHLALLVEKDVPLSNEEYAFLGQVRDLNDRWSYDKRRVAATTMPFLEAAYHREWAKEHGAAYRGHYTRIVRRNIWVASHYFYDRGEFLIVPWETDTPMETYFLGISKNELGLFNLEFFLELPGQLRSVVAWTASDGWRWLFWRPALPLYLAGIACLVLCLRTRDPIWVIVYLPFFINTAVIGLAAISQASRYQYPLTFAAAFLVALAFLPAPLDDAKPTEESAI